jgi:TetR/AcrR family transcriptional regulator, transcriptional repressor for nem operon
MARPKEFDQEKALRKAIRLFSQQGFAATSTDDLMGVMDIGRQSMYDTFGDKRALFLKALKMYVAESVHSINVELEKPGSALSAIQNALVTFAERKDLSSAEGCMGLNAITEFGRQDADVSRISRDAARVLRQALMHVLTRAKNQREISSDAGLDSMADFFESTLAGIRIAAKAGKSRRSLRNMLSRQRSRVRVSSSPPFIRKQLYQVQRNQRGCKRRRFCTPFAPLFVN